MQYNSRKRRKKKIPVTGTVVTLAAIIIFAVIFLIASGGSVNSHSAENTTEIEASVKVLEELESKSPSSFKEKKTAPAPAVDTGDGGSTAAPLDLADEEAKILALNPEDVDYDELNRWFEGTVIMGDSITLAAAEYGVMGYDVICASIGGGLENSDDIAADVISRQPYVLFLCYGNNDISNYLGDPSLFIEKYDAMVQMFKKNLPDTVIYMHDILPVQEGVNPGGFEFREQYNEALEKYCESQDNVYYINADFILENQPELYDADGIHPVGAFYPKWLTYLADCAGLSAKEDK